MSDHKEWEKVIFLAHASEDKSAIRSLHKKLKDNGLHPWLDEEDLDPGVLWEEEIRQAIKKSRIFLACLSKHSVAKSGYIQRELRMALAELETKPAGHIYFIPVLLEDVELPDLSVGTIHLRKYQAVKIYHESGLIKLIEQLKKQLNVIEQEQVKKIQKPALGHIRELITNGKLEEALDALTEQYETQQNGELNTLILLNSRFNNLNKQFATGFISLDEYTTKQNQITYALIELIK